MIIEVIERRTYVVPKLLQANMRAAIKLKDEEELDELISCLEYRVGAEEIHTVNVKVKKVKK